MRFVAATFFIFIKIQYQVKSPPIIKSWHWKSLKWSKKFWKKLGSSSFGAYRVAKVIHFPLVSMSLIINLPVVSKYSRRIWKEKLLLKIMATPPFALEQLLKSDL